jgi:hypothetical protein
MNEPLELIDYKAAMKRTGLSRRTWYDRLKEHRGTVQVYQDGRDRRRHLIDVRDAERLAEIRPAPRREPQGVA